MNAMLHSARRRWILLAFVCVLSLCAAVSRGQGQDLGGDAVSPEIRTEIEYYNALLKLRLDYFAAIQLKRIETTYGAEVRGILDILIVQAELARGDFDAVKAKIAAMPDPNASATWALKMALADAYFAFGKYAEAEGLYQSLFKRYPKEPPKELATFFLNSVYKYVQMMMYTQQYAKAAAGYRQLRGLKLPEHVKRQVTAEMAELLIRLGDEATTKGDRAKYFAEAKALAEEILWIQDLWFGKAIVMLAHMLMVEGDIAGAQEMIETYQNNLIQIDEFLQQDAKEGEDLTRLSPMAECRYLLGVMMHDEALKLMATPGYDQERVKALLAGRRRPNGTRTSGALQHLLNVFIRYPATSWAPDAGERADQIETLLRDTFGARITKSVTDEQMANVRRIQFEQAQISYNQQQFDAAIEKFVAVLNRYPEVDESIGAIGHLARAYTEKQDALYTDMVVKQLAEAYSQRQALSTAAGDELLRLGEYFGERELADKRHATYALYFANYPDHPLAPSMLMMFGERYFRENDFTTALSYYAQVAENYTNSPTYFDAVNKMAYVYGELGQTTNEIAVLTDYIARLQTRDRPGQALAQAKFRLAQAYKNQALPQIRGNDEALQLNGNRVMGSAYKAYQELAKLLENPDNPYQEGSEDQKRNATLREASLFGKAYCLSQLTLPTDKIETYKREAIKGYEEMVANFPKSAFAPQALSQVGTMWTVLKDADKAQAAFARLRDEYADSREARNVSYVLAVNLLELGLRQEAVAVFKEMFADASGQYSAGQFVEAGKELLVAREYDLALDAFQRALAKSEEPGIRAPSLLGRAEALIAKSNYEEAIVDLEKVIEEYGRTKRVVEANLLMSRAASEVGMREPDKKKRHTMFNRAARAIKDIRPYRKTPAELAELDVQAGRILARKAKAEKQFGTPEDAAQAQGSAIANYLIMIDSAKVGDITVAPYLESAYHECVPLMMEIERWDDAVEYASAYLQLFERGKYVVDLRNWLNEAQINQRTAAAMAPVDAMQP